MSRIGKLPIAIPDQVKVTINGVSVTIEGPKGKLTKQFNDEVKITVDETQIWVKPNSNSRQSRAMWGTTRSIIQGMVDGVLKPYERQLEIQGVGFKAHLKGDLLNLALGYSHPIDYVVPEGITITLTGDTKLKVAGPDKQLVGQVSADIKSYYPVEPYKGKGVRIIGQYVRRKEGKKTA